LRCTSSTGIQIRWYFSVFAVLLLTGCCGQAWAQQSDETKPLPDAPSHTANSSPSSQANTDFKDLLAGRSRVFPTLAWNSRPLTPNQKLNLAVRNIVSPYTILGSAAAAGISQARDTYTGYGQGAQGYFKRFGASMGFAASNNLLGAYAIASVLHEDPRYFVLNSHSFRKSVKYAATRVVVTRMDNGKDGINWAGLVGPLGASAIMNSYVPADSQGVGPTFSRWGFSLATAAGTNMLREYWPRINRKLRLPEIDMTPGSTVEPTPAPTNTPPKSYFRN
jgi:hypothetical protein